MGLYITCCTILLTLSLCNLWCLTPSPPLFPHFQPTYFLPLSLPLSLSLSLSQPNNRSRKTFKLKERVLLRHAWVTDTLTLTDGKVPEKGKRRLKWRTHVLPLLVISCYLILFLSLSPPPGFILGTPLKVYHFLAQSSEEKGVWFSELHSRIFAQKRLFNKVGMYSCMYV